MKKKSRYILESIVVGPLASNCYLLADADTKETLIIDPGAEPEEIIREIEANNFKIVGILNTHAHADHIGANEDMINKYKVPLYIHKADAQYLRDTSYNGSLLVGPPLVSPEADVLLEDGQTIEVGSLKGKIIHTPGHTPGGINLLVEDLLFTGDTLFRSSIGRWDFPGGNGKDLMKSLEIYKKLDPDLKVLPGHGDTTTIKNELENNPFLTGENI
ncbi:MAG: MBL fold metallo-hydrolase [Endomicrobiales bacterium]|nr:MBL fold metallo-hydrolase [Endomicrobiales bacterium]